MEKGLSFAKEQVNMGSAAFQAKRAALFSFARTSYTKMTSDNALNVVRSVLGEKAASFTAEKLKDVKKANVYGKVTEKMSNMYKHSAYQVAEKSLIVEEMEAKYIGTTFVSRVRLSIMGCK